MSNTQIYNTTPIVDFYMDLWDGKTIVPSSSDYSIVLSAQYHERPDLLSNDVYGDPKYWWVFMIRNKDVIFDPIFDFKAGTTIIIPPRNSF